MATIDLCNELSKTVGVLEEAYGTAPLLWSPSFADPRGPTSFSQSEIDEIHAVFIYAISPFVFKRPYCHEDLNCFARHVDLFPRIGETCFDPERHNPRKEEQCCRLISFVQNIILFAYNAQKKGHLNMLVGRILQDRYDVHRCIEYAKEICAHIFGSVMSPEKAFHGLFVIVLAIVNDIDRLSAIKQILKQKDDTPETIELSKQAKNFVKSMDFEDALRIYKEILKTRTYDHYIYGNLAQVYISLEEFVRAEWCSHRAILINPKWPKSHYRYIRAVECQGNIQKAFEISSAVAHLAEAVPDFFNGSIDLLAELHSQQQELFSKALHYQVFAIESEKTKKYPKQRNRTSVTCSSKNSTSSNPKLPASSIGSMANNSKADTSKKKADCSSIQTSNATKTEDVMAKADPEDAPTLNDEKYADKFEGETLISSGSKKQNIAPVSVVANGSEELVKASNKKKSKAAKKKTAFENYVNLVKGGSEALISENFKVAFLKYSMALDVYQEKGLKGLGLSILDIILLKYCFALTCIGKGTYEDITLGLQTFQEIIDVHYDVAFPLAYYGKARCFTALNRYTEAKDPLEKLKNIINKKIKLEVYEFPYCDGKIIEESQPGKLRNLVDDMHATCHAPPSPNAICRHATETSHLRREIYYNDPDFQGYTELICQERCHLQYHPNCWKEMKEEYKLPREKDFLGKQCMTPDCYAVIVRIELYGADGVLRKTFSGESEVKTKVKEQSSQVKNVKESKKPMKTFVRQRSHAVSENSIEESHSVDKLPDCVISECNIEGKKAGFVTDIHSMPDLRKDALVVFKKRQTEDANTILEKRLHQKKQKQKHLLHFEFENSDASRIQQLKYLKHAAENSNPKKRLDRLWQRPVALDPVSPFAFPNVEDDFALEKWLRSVDKNSLKDKERIEENIIEYLENYLKTNGPTSLISQKFISEMADFPIEAQVVLQESGGMQPFLLNSKRFEFISDILLLPKHFYVLTWNSASLLWVLDLAVQGCNPRNTLWSNYFSFQPLMKAISLPCVLESVCPSLPNNYFNEKFTISVDEALHDIFGLNGDVATNCAKILHNYSGTTNSSHSSCSDLVSNSGHSLRHHSTSASTSTDVSNYVLEPNKRMSNLDFCEKESSDHKISRGKVVVYDLPVKAVQANHLHNSGTSGTGCEGNSQQKTTVLEVKTSKSTDQAVNSLKMATLKSEFSSVDAEVNISDGCPLCTEMQILKKKYELSTDQCQDLKDKLMQKQNELQLLKTMHKRDMDDKDERYKKMQKRFDILQSNHDKTCKQIETEKNKYNNEIKALNDKIKLLSTEKESLASELREAQRNVQELVTYREEQVEAEKLLRIAAEDELRTVKDALEIVQSDCIRFSKHEIFLNEKVKNLEMQINRLNKNTRLASEQLNYQHHQSAFIDTIPRPVHWSMPPQPPPRFIPVGGFRNSFLGPYPMSSSEAFQNGRPWVPLHNFTTERQSLQSNTLLNTPSRSSSVSDLTKASLGMTFGQRGPLHKRSSSPNPNTASLNLSSPPSSYLASESPTHQISKNSNIQDDSEPPSRIKDDSRKASNVEDDCLPLATAFKNHVVSYAECAAVSSKKHRIVGPVGKFRDMLEALQREFPTLTQTDFTKYILDIRARHNKTLSGIKMRTIVNEVRTSIRSKDSCGGSQQKKPYILKTTSPSLGLDKFVEVPLAWSVVPEAKSGSKCYLSDECYICLEKMVDSNNEFLPCGHVYHNLCIKKWFDKNSTCPICREHSLLPKEYPPLK